MRIYPRPSFFLSFFHPTTLIVCCRHCEVSALGKKKEKKRKSNHNRNGSHCACALGSVDLFPSGCVYNSKINTELNHTTDNKPS